MYRKQLAPRLDWQRIVEDQGLDYHTIDGDLYWDESAYYEFTARQVDTLEAATNDLHAMSIEAVQHVLDEDRLDEFQIPAALHEWVRSSWDRDDPSLFGRFDLVYDGVRPPQMLEYNADTPTSLFEAGAIQWFWLQDVNRHADQFNSIHERLVATWAELRQALRGPLHFASVEDHDEDFGNVRYLQDTAAQAGWTTAYIPIEQIAFDAGTNQFVDEAQTPIHTLFKLYPWEWLVREEFGAHLPKSSTHWIEPPWKMLLSNKSLLVVLWELFPDSPYLLPAAYEPLGPSHVRKPCLSREGSNVTIVRDGRQIDGTTGPYADGPVVFQQYRELPDFSGNFPVIGSWIVGGEACGLGIREDRSRITHNMSRFVPHLFR